MCYRSFEIRVENKHIEPARTEGVCFFLNQNVSVYIMLSKTLHKSK